MKDLRNNPKLSRGLRNNNPGNLRASGIKWKGAAGIDSANFVVFSSLDYGIRAMLIDLASKYKRGLNTITKILTVYAPPSENNTPAYIDFVSKMTGIAPNEDIKPIPANLAKIALAMIYVENGKVAANYITPEDVLNGMRLVSPESAQVADSGKIFPIILGIGIIGLILLNN